jgi:lipopolysaccharide transport system ATP-binding protein
MSSIAVRSEDLSKCYQVGRTDNHFPTLRDALADLWRSGIGRKMKPPRDAFWALRNVSFTISHGESIGIIGRNGAGKSTLLKILSRITRPTHGTATIHGRLASLLEVGTGFHPELTGRENIFLNGAILGMSRSDTLRRFDEIVAFAEVSAFLDTPVKRYSTGMYLRLAFAVAAHLEPDILVVDEVLAVGDLAFQKKCLGRMRDVSKQGRTVLLVSHNLGAVQTLCDRAILLREGRISADGKATETVAAYLADLEASQSIPLAHRADRQGAGLMRITNMTATSDGDGALAAGRPARFAFDIAGHRAGAACSFTIYDELGQPLMFFDSGSPGRADSTEWAGAVFTCEIDELLLLPGRYRINVGLTWGGALQDHVEGAVFIDVHDGEIRGRPAPAASGYGSVAMPHIWRSPG